MKSSGVSWRYSFADTLNSMGCGYTKYEPEVWINRATTENGTAYIKYMLVYVYDVIHLAKDAQEDMLKLHQVYKLKRRFWATR